jgi:hypothetical protein
MELKPCPFCGGEVNEVIKPEDRGYLTICCGLVGSMISVAEWNTRPIEDALQKRIAELEACPEHPYVKQLQQRIAELETELDWCKHAGRVMTELHDEKCKRITELEAQNLKLCKFETFGDRFYSVVNDLLKAESEQDKKVE